MRRGIALFLFFLLLPAWSFSQADTVAPVYTYIERLPVFPFGDLPDYLRKNVIYPPVALLNEVEGRVTLKFCINEAGLADCITVTGPVHPLLDSEAVRVVRSLPRCTPGASKRADLPGDFKVSKVYFNVPISFTMTPSDRKQRPVASRSDAERPERYPWLAANDGQFSAPQYRIVPNPSRKNRALCVEVLVDAAGEVRRVQPVLTRWSVDDPAVFEAFRQSLGTWPPRRWTPAVKAGRPVPCTMLLPLTY